MVKKKQQAKQELELISIMGMIIIFFMINNILFASIQISFIYLALLGGLIGFALAYYLK